MSLTAIGKLAVGFVSANLWSGISSILTIVGIVFAAIYWWVLQRQALRQQRWDQYQKSFELVWNSSNNVPSGLQVAAVYQLVEFKEFSYATVRALESSLANQGNEGWKQIVGDHLEAVAKLIKRTSHFRRQEKKFKNKNRS